MPRRDESAAIRVAVAKGSESLRLRAVRGLRPLPQMLLELGELRQDFVAALALSEGPGHRNGRRGPRGGEDDCDLEASQAHMGPPKGNQPDDHDGGRHEESREQALDPDTALTT